LRVFVAPFISVNELRIALFAIEHQTVFAFKAEDLIARRALLLRSLRLPGVAALARVTANMILIRVPDAARTPRHEGRGVIKNVSNSILCWPTAFA
jgi:histidinol-phosphate aminotransferase